MPTREVYAEARRRLLDLADGLDGAAAARSVPALPGWSIKDTYAHLAGICVDVLDDRRARHPEWGERTVAERRDRSLAEVAVEWSARAPELEGRLEGRQGFPSRRRRVEPRARRPGSAPPARAHPGRDRVGA